ncbi:MAG: hypothetical protein JWP74_3458 [Marmoricola sp.]|nr:hypothetical protein [Marmoricola sp.]
MMPVLWTLIIFIAFALAGTLVMARAVLKD